MQPSCKAAGDPQTSICCMLGSSQQALSSPSVPSGVWQQHHSSTGVTPASLDREQLGRVQSLQARTDLPREGLFEVSFSTEEFQMNLANGTGEAPEGAGSTCTRWICLGVFCPKMLQVLGHCIGNHTFIPFLGETGRLLEPGHTKRSLGG